MTSERSVSIGVSVNDSPGGVQSSFPSWVWSVEFRLIGLEFKKLTTSSPPLICSLCKEEGKYPGKKVPSSTTVPTGDAFRQVSSDPGV